MHKEGEPSDLAIALEPADNRTKVFYRGYDVFDSVQVGFVSDISRFDEESRNKEDSENPRKYFRFDTQVSPGGLTPRDRNEGNSNVGHEGPAYGTTLSGQEKDAIVEYLKTF